MTILDKIIKQKKIEVAELKKQTPATPQTKQKQVEKISETFRNDKQMNIVAEIKRASPSKGDISMTVDPVEQAKVYASHGAGAISVLTDQTFFKGSMDDLRAVRDAVDVPILCKDFMIDPIQIDQAKAAGASIILLIVAALSEEQVHTLYNYATDQGLEVLCEVHNETEMKTAIDLGAEIIGINNRNLKTFEVDLAVTELLASMAPNLESILISESGIRSQADVERIVKRGVNGILVGETLMRADNLADTFETLKTPLFKGGSTHAR